MAEAVPLGAAGTYAPPLFSSAARTEAALRAAIAGGGLGYTHTRRQLSALEAALAAAPREVREGGVGREARARRDRLLEAQQEAEHEAKQEAAAEAARLAADEGGRDLAIATASSVPGMQRKVILSGGRLQGCGGSPMEKGKRPESVPAGARKRVPP